MNEGTMKITAMLGAALMLAILGGCKKPADKVADPKNDTGAQIAAKLHEPIDKAKGVSATLEKAAQESAAQIKAETDEAEAPKK